MAKKLTVVQEHKENFETLKRAFASGDVAIMECLDRETGEELAVLCAVEEGDGECRMIPFASFFNGNPYDMLLSPMQVDELANQEEG